MTCSSPPRRGRDRAARLCRRALLAVALSSPCLTACRDRAEREPPSAPRTVAAVTSSAADTAFSPTKLERNDTAMGTSLHFIAYTTPSTDAAHTEAAFSAAIAEMRRLESLLSEWRDDSDVGRINLGAGHWVQVGPEAVSVIEKALWAGKASSGTFDITFQVMSDLWKFGSAQEEHPTPPPAALVAKRRALIDYRKVELDVAGRRVRIPAGRKIGLGGIAKGYIVDKAVAVLRKAGLRAFLVQAGGDLYGAGRKPDGSPWISGIRDPRDTKGGFFATIALEDHAFSTAGDYARYYIWQNRRYHHIIDPRTGYPATASRSVTVWAEDALTADMIDDAVFILGPEQGLKLADSLDGVGVLIVDAHNKVWKSARLEGKIAILKQPTDAL